MGAFAVPSKILILLFLCCELIGSKKINSRDSGSSKFSECRRCKLLTDSFNHWLDKTSRGKYEGGDAAWEEAKLKSYSRSEIRLVEIQEGLCSELKTGQDACYSIAEEAEQVLETWWFHEDPNSADLYTWLCIENLQHCCPKGHFGDACSACPKDKNNRICGGHGRCDGDGTRKGNGTCSCRKGFTGVTCNECSTNYYFTNSGTCEQCHESCDGCVSGGPDGCESCKPGFELLSGTCTDIDECAASPCEANEYCENTEGSYSCAECDLSCEACKGEGPSNCTSCESSNVLWFGSCIDDEFKQNIITNAFRRLALYIGLITITLYTFRKSHSSASFVILGIAIFIYFYEKNLKMTTFRVIVHELTSSN